MANPYKKLTFLLVLFGLFLIVTFQVNKWVSNEMNSYEVKKTEVNQKVKEVKPVEIKKRKRVTINPKNDPLAPVIKSRNNTQKVETPRKLDPKPVYDKVETTTILVQ